MYTYCSTCEELMYIFRILNSKCVMNTIKTRNETITFNDLPQKNDQFADQNDFYHFSNAVHSIQTLGYFFIIIKEKIICYYNLKGFCVAVYFILSF